MLRGREELEKLDLDKREDLYKNLHEEKFKEKEEGKEIKIDIEEEEIYNIAGKIDMENPEFLKLIESKILRMKELTTSTLSENENASVEEMKETKNKIFSETKTTKLQQMKKDKKNKKK